MKRFRVLGAVVGSRRAAVGCALALFLALGLVSCALHPRGEREERELARKAYVKHAPAPLAPGAPLEEILDYAYATNGDLERLWWEWIAAIEAIPQDAVPGTNLAISAESMFEEGKTSLSRTTLGLGNDPMSNIPWPGKVSTAAKRSLETARARGFRFQAGKLDLRWKVLGAYYAYALLGESLRLKQAEVGLTDVARDAVAARVQAGMVTSNDLLTAANEHDLALNDLENLRADVPGKLAAINALLDREPTAPLDLPGQLPARRELPYTDAQILGFLAERNPELAALAHEAASNEQAVKMMRQQYIPDLGLTLSGDLDGMTRSIMAMITAPVVRRDAIEASIKQAQAELEASRAMRRQAESDLKAHTVAMLYDLRNAERQADFYEGTIIPRLSEAVETTGASYAAGQASMADLVDDQRMLLRMRLMAAEMRMERESVLAELEAMAALGS